MARKLTEKQAWRYIAMRIAERGWTESGLCREVRLLRYREQISDNTSHHMYRRIELYLGGSVWAYPYGKDNEEARILAALWMALDAEEKN